MPQSNPYWKVNHEWLELFWSPDSFPILFSENEIKRELKILKSKNGKRNYTLADWKARIAMYNEGLQLLKEKT
jgi:hypothetical protein